MVAGRDAALVTTSDEQRWADAESILDGVPTEEARRRLRRFRRTVLALVVGLAVVGGVLGGIVGAAGAHRSRPTPDPAWGWQQTVGLVLGLVGMVVVVVVLVVQWRSGRLRFAWNNPALVLTRRQRKQLSAEIRGRRPAGPRHLRVARALAAHGGSPGLLTALFAGLLLLLVGPALLTPSGGRWLYTGAMCVAYTALMGFAVRSSRQVQRFLAEHPDPQAAQG